MSALQGIWRKAAGALALSIALFGPLSSSSSAHTQPTIQQVAFSSNPWLGVAAESETALTNPRHRPPSPTTANAVTPVHMQTDPVRPQRFTRPAGHPVLRVMHRKLPPPCENCPDAH